MKLNLKMIAVAAAMVAAGSAHAFTTTVGQSTGNSSLIVYAFNTVTNDYYARDLGFNLNSFLPNSVTTLAGDGGVTGDKTPNAGLTLDKTNTASFADASFVSWLAGQSGGAANVKWSLFAGDNTTTGANGVDRLLIASSTDLTTINNATVRNAVPTATGVNGLLTLAGGSWTGLSTTGSNVPAQLTANSINFANTLSSLDAASSVYYFSATTQSGSGPTLANATKYGNSTGFASVLLASNGDFTYSLAGPVSAVPVPAAAWLLGTGLMGIGGMIRRRKAAAQA